MTIDLRRREHSLFGSASMTAHVARGAVAALLLTWATVGEDSHPWASLAAGAVALVALRGCPVCWTIGLFETMRAKRP
ncbi:hypothetical protein DFR50_12667 [Roseiarcus fermentans]|uniref:DUF2892 family protein n=1 Tax=Roseiarcus fermentans TaxID=1473586 RepID=A0A366F0N0_9HYPH|nr:hypothetical protein [Roseiarcus fermentans]RBP08222.1 hypothetical protein DFR50_12667 [Roseiarcus fermentans]